MGKFTRWTEDEDQVLCQLWPCKSKEERQEIRKLLPSRTWKAIESRACSHLKLSNDTRLKAISDIHLTERAKVALAWAIACDGSIMIHIVKRRYTNYSPSLNVNTTDRELAEAVQAFAGCGTIYYCGISNGNRPIYRWTTYRTLAIKQILEQILPELPIKRKQAELVIELCNLRISRNFKPGLQDREREIREEVHTLNVLHRALGVKT